MFYLPSANFVELRRLRIKATSPTCGKPSADPIDSRKLFSACQVRAAFLSCRCDNKSTE